MNGLELARSFYETCGKPMLETEFCELLPYLAIGLTGSGSECFGYDDAISRDHDFEPGFCIFLPSEAVVDRRAAFLLERAYYKLPREFMGFKRSLVNPVGGNRHGVLRIADFFTEKVGHPDGELTVHDWLTLPLPYLAEATNGELFADPYGEMTSIRAKLQTMPEDVRRKRLAGHLLLMAQSGQYNYARCMAHNETGAAQLAAIKFAENTMQTVFLLNRSYLPFYKWSFRAMRELPVLSPLADTLEYLIASENDSDAAQTKQLVMEDVAQMIIAELQQQSLTTATCNNLETHAYSVNDLITDADIRNLHILAAV